MLRIFFFTISPHLRPSVNFFCLTTTSNFLCRPIKIPSCCCKFFFFFHFSCDKKFTSTARKVSRSAKKIDRLRGETKTSARFSFESRCTICLMPALCIKPNLSKKITFLTFPNITNFLRDKNTSRL